MSWRPEMAMQCNAIRIALHSLSLLLSKPEEEGKPRAAAIGRPRRRAALVGPSE